MSTRPKCECDFHHLPLKVGVSVWKSLHCKKVSGADFFKGFLFLFGLSFSPTICVWNNWNTFLATYKHLTLFQPQECQKSPMYSGCHLSRGEGGGPCFDLTVKSRKEKISPDFTDGKQWLAAQHRRPVHSLHKQCVSRYIVCSTILYIVILYYIVHCMFYNIETKVYCRKEGCVGLRGMKNLITAAWAGLLNQLGIKYMISCLGGWQTGNSWSWSKLKEETTTRQGYKRPSVIGEPFSTVSNYGLSRRGLEAVCHTSLYNLVPHQRSLE